MRLFAIDARRDVHAIELSKLRRAGAFEDLMTRQGQFHDAVEAAITDLEELAVQLQPTPEEGAAQS